MSIAFSIFTGFIFDCIFGDPRRLPHPICLIGNFISLMEKLLRRAFPKSERGELAGGAVLAVAVPAAAFGVSFMILRLCEAVNPVLKFAVETFFCYQIFAAKSLKDESMRVYRYVEAGDIENSRKYLSWIVGRDTEDLSFEKIDKAVVETVAENTSDGVVAPLIFMAVGGAPLAFLYKGVNTLDSMVGYKNDRYLYFGRASAKLDDLLNFIPARLTGLAMCAGAFFTGLDWRTAFRIYRRDRKNHSSPNSAHPESACAGALNIQLGGDAYYFGKLYRKKTIGDDIRPVDSGDIKLAIRLMYAASVICLVLAVAARILVFTVI
ncbi:MAG TPA: adenosylcobinamide-phosphate synthase CbiB [Candidatus Avanaerovorax faecigallinarum]|nr:adenosylcobinamide-phosphate synthase CbiB [Candidatus Avanaerovorax faecigallinarum]